MPAKRCVIVGDVIGSRSVTDRAALRQTLETGVERANAAVESDLSAPFAILKGVDEIGGVLADPARAYTACRVLAEAIHPVEIRLAVVWGEVDVGVDAGSVAAMDGPAFHEADAVLARIEGSDRYVGLSIGGSVAPVVESLLENLVDLLFVWKSEWTERQAELVGRYRERDTMAAVADEVGVSVQSVSKTLDRARAERVLAIETEITAAFEDVADAVSER